MSIPPSKDRAVGDPELRTEPIEALDRRYQALRVSPARARLAALAASLERNGQQQPVLASSRVERGRLVLLDGFKRVDLLGARGVERVWVTVVGLDGPSSLAALAAANAGDHSALSDLEEAWIVAKLEGDHGLSQADIATLLGRHRSWVCRRLSLCQRLERVVQDDVRLGLVSISAAREIARLPRGNQAAAARAVTAHGLACPQVSRLVSVLRGADPDTRREILSDPLAHLRQREPPRPQGFARPDSRLSPAANGVREQLLRIHAAAGRLDEILLGGAIGGCGSKERALLEELGAPILDKARAALDRLETAIGKAPEERARAF